MFWKKNTKPAAAAAAAERGTPMMESLEERQLFSHHSVFATRLTFTATPTNQTIDGSSWTFPVAAKLTAAGKPLRTAQILFVEDNAQVVGFGETGRSGYVSGNIATLGPGKHTIFAYFGGSTRYLTTQSKATYSATSTLPSTTPTTLPDGLKVTTLAPGNGGLSATSGQYVMMRYIGYKKSDGITFDSSESIGHSQFSFQLDGGNVIAGFNEGVKGMQQGEVRLLEIPPSIGYGSDVNNPLHTETLYFLVQVVAISNTPFS
jgi:hypothetical protein